MNPEIGTYEHKAISQSQSVNEVQNFHALTTRYSATKCPKTAILPLRILVQITTEYDLTISAASDHGNLAMQCYK